MIKCTCLRYLVFERLEFTNGWNLDHFMGFCVICEGHKSSYEVSKLESEVSPTMTGVTGPGAPCLTLIEGFETSTWRPCGAALAHTETGAN
jgi:hypothetical protein